MRWTRTRAVSTLNALDGVDSRNAEVTGESGEVQTVNMHTSELTSLADVALTNGAQFGNDSSREALLKNPRLRFDQSSTLSQQHRHQLIADFDGFGSSGRFISLLQSQSAVLRSRLFADWTDDITIPWLHFIPVSVSLQEIWDILVHFLKSGQSASDLARIASSSRQLANDWMRKDDQVVYAHRLVLEWARMTHDGRDRGEMDFQL